MIFLATFVTLDSLLNHNETKKGKPHLMSTETCEAHYDKKKTYNIL